MAHCVLQPSPHSYTSPLTGRELALPAVHVDKASSTGIQKSNIFFWVISAQSWLWSLCVLSLGNRGVMDHSVAKRAKLPQDYKCNALGSHGTERISILPIDCCCLTLLLKWRNLLELVRLPPELHNSLKGIGHYIPWETEFLCQGLLSWKMRQTSSLSVRCRNWIFFIDFHVLVAPLPFSLFFKNVSSQCFRRQVSTLSLCRAINFGKSFNTLTSIQCNC